MEDRIPIFRSLEMIEENIREKLTVAILADRAHFSKYHYQRLFREAVGDTVMAYVSRRRLTLAAQELAETNRTVLEIALKYGYDSHEGFTRSFKAHMGVTPAEYRKYRLFPAFLPMKAEKERSAMMYSKTTQEIVRELNSLIVQARDTGAVTRKEGRKPEAGSFYTQFWNYTAGRTEAMADKLEKMLEGITIIQHTPDEIASRFSIIKAVEDIAFEASITAFQTGLMIARANGEQRSVFQPLCEKYDLLAQNARLKSQKTADFLNELAALIFRDMRKNAEQKIQETVAAGRAAAEKLYDPKLPYGYIAEAVAEIAEELSSVPLEEVTCRLLEDDLVRLDTVVLAADMDMFRVPDHEALFEQLSGFREKMEETWEFFEAFSEKGIQKDMVQKEAQPQTNGAEQLQEAQPQTNGAEQLQETQPQTNGAEQLQEAQPRTKQPGPMQETQLPGRSRIICGKKDWEVLIFQEKILLFYLKGEIQKLRFSELGEERIAVLEDIAARFDHHIKLIRDNSKNDEDEVTALITEIYEKMTAESEKMGIYGGPVRYIAEEIRKPVQKK